MQLAFFRVIDNQSQRMIIYKKCLGICNGYNEEGVQVVSMIIELAGAMGMFKEVDKSD